MGPWPRYRTADEVNMFENSPDNRPWPHADWPLFMLNHMPVGVVSVDSNLSINYMNPEAQRLTGYTLDEADGHYCGEILHGGYCGKNCPLRMVLTKGKSSLSVETTITTKERQLLPVRLYTSALFNSQGQLQGALEAFVDISEIKDLEKKHAHTLSLFAHDMKSPLIAIYGLADRLIAGKAGAVNGKQSKYLNIILNQVKRVQNLVFDFLDMTRSGDSEEKPAMSQIDLGEVLRALEVDYAELADQKGLDLQFVIQPDLPVVLGDPIVYPVFSATCWITP